MVGYDNGRGKGNDKHIGKVETLEKSITLELQTSNLTRFLVYPVQLKHKFGNSDTNDCFANTHVGPFGLPVEITMALHLGHFDAVGP